MRKTFSEWHQLYLDARIWGMLQKTHPVPSFDQLMAFVIEDAEAKFHEIRAKYPYVTRAMTMRDFYRICNRENIWRYIDRLGEDGTLGKYFHDTEKTRPAIALEINQNRTSMRMTMAHEVAHHFLHRESIKSGEVKPWNTDWKPGMRLTELGFTGVHAEMEADALGAMFLAGGNR